jgi:UDP-N-acetylmuramate--alanine ligase
LFGDFLTRANACVVNADNAEALAIAPQEALTFGLSATARLRAVNIAERPEGVDFDVLDSRSGETVAAWLAVPGRHNVANALAAIGAASLAGVPLELAVSALGSFSGLRRRMELVGTNNCITVIDDFGHNPDKIAATLSALHAFPGRLLLFFQPHGYGPLKLMGRELADSFIANMKPDDRLIVSDPAYFGGTVDRSIGSDTLVAMVGAQAEHIPARPEIAARLIDLSQPGDRIVVMGARDDTLSTFAAGLLDALPSS